TLGNGPFCRCRLVRFRVMAESKETPSVRFGETLTVLHSQVDAVERAVEEAAPGRLGAGSIRESRIKQARQFLDDDRALREHTRLHVGVDVLRLDIYIVEFGKVGHPIVQTIRR